MDIATITTLENMTKTMGEIAKAIVSLEGKILHLEDKIDKGTLIIQAIDKIIKHEKDLKKDYGNKIITEENYMYRSDECQGIIQLLEDMLNEDAE